MLIVSLYCPSVFSNVYFIAAIIHFSFFLSSLISFKISSLSLMLNHCRTIIFLQFIFVYNDNLKSILYNVELRRFKCICLSSL